MSAWKLVLRRLYSLGGEAPRNKIDDGTVYSISGALNLLARCGLVKSPGMHGYQRPMPWKITPKGILFCEGKLEAIRDGPKGMKWRATWLNPLASYPEQESQQLTLW